MIETGFFIDLTDPNWKFFLVFEKNEFFYTFAGYLNFYPFYRSMNECRTRISQVVILPPFQRKGLATELLEVIFI